VVCRTNSEAVSPRSVRHLETNAVAPVGAARLDDVARGAPGPERLPKDLGDAPLGPGGGFGGFGPSGRERRGERGGGFKDGPVLLVSGGSIQKATQAELTRLKPKRIMVLGGTAVVPEAVEKALAAYLR